MEVTRNNFSEVFAELESVIKSSQFLAIDGEFTGLKSGQDVNAYDTPAQYYAKLRAGYMDFLLVQLGLCTFHYDSENDKYTHRAYNLYVFPRPYSRTAPDPCFLCQSSSIDFLISQGFDFNKLFREGISYLKEADEKKLRENLEEKIKARANSMSSPKNDETSMHVPIPDEYISVIEDTCMRIKDFLSKDEPEELVLDRCNAFVRKLIYQTVSERFDRREVHLETRTVENQNRVLVVTRDGGEETRKRKEEEKIEQERKEIDAAVGITKVIKLISQSEKLIIGHNMLLDLCHIIHQFCTPLPESYFEFKELATFLFPRVVDTKFMSCNPPFKDLISSTVLGHLCKTLSEEPFQIVTAAPAEEGKGYSGTQEKAHEAGYDAFVTGQCFLTMLNYLGSIQQPPQNPVLPSSPLLKEFINKMHLVRLQDLPYIHLGADDPVPPRNHVFHVTFPKEWKLHDLTQLFSPFGSIHVSWINDTSAYIGLYRRDQAGLVLRTLTQNDKYTVIPYSRHQKMQQQQAKNTTSFKTSSKHNTIPYSPTRIARKRRSLELLALEGEQLQPSDARKKSRGSIGAYSKRSIEPIPEEMEAEDSKGSEGMICHKAKRSKSNPETRNMVQSSPSTSSGRKEKQFQENDTWE